MAKLLPRLYLQYSPTLHTRARAHGGWAVDVRVGVKDIQLLQSTALI